MSSTINVDNKEEILEIGDLVVNYTDGDVVIFDHLKDVTKLFPLQTMTNIVAICISGHGEMNISGNKIKIEANDVLVCPHSVRIDEFEISDDFECKVLSLSDRLIQGLLHDKIEIWHQAVYVKNINVIRMSEACKEQFGYYYALIHSKIENKARHPAHQVIIQALIRALLLEMCFILEHTQGQQEIKETSQGKMLFNRFLTTISRNDIKRRPISYYASELAITPKYLTMLCLKFSNKTASQWIIQYTKEDIRFFLKNSNLSIKEISAKLGFANMSHFGSYVRKHLGVSPSDFRHKRNVKI